MTTLILTLTAFLLTFAGLSLSLFFRRPAIKGRCGGHEGLGDRLSCTSCDCKGSDSTAPNSVKAVTLLPK